MNSATTAQEHSVAIFVERESRRPRGTLRVNAIHVYRKQDSL